MFLNPLVEAGPSISSSVVLSVYVEALGISILTENKEED
jgi:hypothetical protein